jgi:transcriptional regulator with XRE-family HTH domain
MNRLAYGLRRTRLEFGLNMSEMADILGVHVATVSRIESGDRGLTNWCPEAVAADLGIPVADLLRPCPQCHYAPDPGFLCLRCGCAGQEPTERQI